MKTSVRTIFLVILVVFGLLVIAGPAMAADNTADNDAAASFALASSGIVRITPLAQPALVKAVFNGATCIASDDSDALCNNTDGVVTPVNIPSGATLTFVIYATNPSTSSVTLTDIRFNDVLSAAVPGGFTFIPGSLSWGTRAATGADKTNIRTAALTTGGTDAFDGDPVGFTGATVSAGGTGTAGVDNIPVNIAPDEVFAIAFNVTLN